MMSARLWGTRGSLASPGTDTAHYGGNTSCVEVRGADGTVLVLDAGTGIRPLGDALPSSLKRVDLLLTHLHMDHIQGLGFFAPLYRSDIEVHIWGPASTTLSLRTRLTRYLSPPLFPVHLRDLPCKIFLHEVPCGDFHIGPFCVSSALVCHPGPTVGYRIATDDASLAYIPDHEPALGLKCVSSAPEWTSGYELAAGVDLLIHDAQYTDGEYCTRVGWGHCSIEQALQFATLAQVKELVLFHHDPAHSDREVDELMAAALASQRPKMPVIAAAEGFVFRLGESAVRAARV
jgi:phosphoribosyl 1,2-cyclic phosphodiesterase